jgi:hypothetical protein
MTDSKLFRGIALVGNGGVGKTTLTRYLTDNFLVRSSHPKDLFASMVTPILLKMGVPLDEIADRCFGKSIDDPLPHPYIDKTTRSLLRAAGGGFLADLGIEGIAHQLTLPPPQVPVIIESVRRVEEAHHLASIGFALVLVSRPSLGGPSYAHSTEMDLSGVRVDHTIVNDGYVEDLMLEGLRCMQRFLNIKPVTAQHRVLVINGRPGAGKDALTFMLMQRCVELGVACKYYSSIAPVKSMLEESGIDVSNKTPADRDLLAEIKAALEKHGNWCTKSVLSEYRKQYLENEDRASLLITHVREPANIEYINRQVGCVSMWLMRPGLAESGATNAADRTNAAEYDYQLLVKNDGSLEDLEEQSAQILQNVFSS